MAKKTRSLTSLALFVLTSAGVGIIDPTHTVITTAEAAVASQSPFITQVTQDLANENSNDLASLLMNPSNANQLSSISNIPTIQSQDQTAMTTMANAIVQTWNNSSQFSSILTNLGSTATTTFNYAVTNYNNSSIPYGTRQYVLGAAVEGMAANFSSEQWASLDSTTLSSANLASMFGTIYSTQNAQQYSNMINGLNSNPANAGALLKNLAQNNSAYISTITTGLDSQNPGISPETFSSSSMIQAFQGASNAVLSTVVGQLNSNQFSSFMLGAAVNNSGGTLGNSIFQAGSSSQQAAFNTLLSSNGLAFQNGTLVDSTSNTAINTLSSSQYNSLMSNVLSNAGSTNDNNDLAAAIYKLGSSTQLQNFNSILQQNGWTFQNGTIMNSSNQPVSGSQIANALSPQTPATPTMGATSPSMKNTTDSALEAQTPTFNPNQAINSSQEISEEPTAQSEELSPQPEQPKGALTAPPSGL